MTHRSEERFLDGTREVVEGGDCLGGQSEVGAALALILPQLVDTRFP